jgi:hypothetical protein
MLLCSPCRKQIPAAGELKVKHYPGFTPGDPSDSLVRSRHGAATELPPKSPVSVPQERSNVSRHRSPRSIARLVLSLSLTTAGCSLPDTASPEFLNRSARASLMLNTQVIAVAADKLNARVTYARNGGAPPGVLIDSTVSIHKTEDGAVEWEGVRSFPVEIDLAPCLLDPNHKAVSGGCEIGITVRLLQGNTQVDIYQMTPFALVPGRITIVDRVVVLREVGQIEIDSPVQLLRVGEGVPLSARVLDVAGNPVQGREVLWRSSDSGIARVGADGMVIGVAAGQATLTARAGTREGSRTLTVWPR